MLSPAPSPIRLLLCSLLLLSGCERSLTGAGSGSPSPTGTLGVMDVTISGIGGDPVAMTATGRSVTANGGGPSFALSPVSGITLARESSGSFTRGVRGAGGQRYFSATFRVTNGSGGPVSNLTMIPMGDGATIAGTPFTGVRRFDGAAADPALAAQMRPTGAAILDLSLRLGTYGPDVLQVFTEPEVAALVGTSVPNPMPYGFVVRNSLSASTRALATGSSDGLVTVAYRVPLQATVQQDVFSVTFRVVLAQDSETKVTQSLEEQNPAGTAAVIARVQSLGATLAVVLPGNGEAMPMVTRPVCSVRTAGTPASPAALLFPTPPSFLSMSPSPYSGAGSVIPQDGPLSATFSAPVAATSQNFVSNASVLGRRFLIGSYGGAGTSTATTPSPHFAPGEVVETSLTGGLGLCGGRVARHRVRAALATGTFPATVSYSNSGVGRSVAFANLDGDVLPDLVTGNEGAVSVRLSLGLGGFAPPTTYAVSGSIRSVAVGDLNGDGRMDLVAAGSVAKVVSVLLGTGGGAFAPAVSYPVADDPLDIVMADLNGDGRLDLAVTTTYNVWGWFGNGAGGLSAAEDLSYGSLIRPVALAVGDLNRDGILDLAVSSHTNSGSVKVLIGTGGGDFLDIGTLYVGSQPVSVAIGDMNADGLPDLVVGNASGQYFSNTVLVLLGTGSGLFAPATIYPTAVDPTALALGDVNGDGLLDLAVAMSSGFETTSGEVAVRLGVGGGALGPAVGYPSGLRPQDVVLVDINYDGKLDMATAVFAPGAVAVSLAP